jgi:5-methylcytosine-specific restriction endonuclease McrA
MLKACSRCGKIHPYSYQCTKGKVYRGGEERKLRSSYQWKKKSEDIRQKAGYLCEYCKTENRYTYRNLEVHHIEKVREDPSLLLDDYNLICLCTECHKKADAGTLDADFLRELARKREEGIGMGTIENNG